MNRGVGVQGVLSEFGGVHLSDERLDRRLASIVRQVAVAPAESFPERMGSPAEREALYRFLANPRVMPSEVMAGHVEETRARIRKHSEIRVIHDTTDFAFEGDREGLGFIEGRVRGFLGHFALAVGPGEEREPLGVLAILPYVHEDTEVRRQMTNAERILHTRAKPREKKESSRWERLAQPTLAAPSRNASSPPTLRLCVRSPSSSRWRGGCSRCDTSRAPSPP